MSEAAIGGMGPTAETTAERNDRYAKERIRKRAAKVAAKSGEGIAHTDGIGTVVHTPPPPPPPLRARKESETVNLNAAEAQVQESRPGGGLMLLPIRSVAEPRNPQLCVPASHELPEALVQALYRFGWQLRVPA